jgi:PAS domain S-box-containing protein
MEMLTGYTQREVLGKDCELLHCRATQESDVMATPQLTTVAGGEVAVAVECTLQRRDGGLVPVLRNARGLQDSAGHATGTVHIFTDLRPLKALQAQVARLRSRLAWPTSEGLVGRSEAMDAVRAAIRLAAESTATVLILGETGTGKELVAEAIHFESARREKPLVKVNCSALPETLLESELFGHARGAFTGAVKDKPGRFELADGGTLFLDEIGDLSPLIQLKLLRVLQQHEFERVGESRVRQVDVRIIAATHRDLRRLLGEGRFREDLFYRLNVFPIPVPALRERTKDIPLLLDHFLERFNRETGKRISRLSADVRRIFMDFCWPGNVRQLENAIEHAFVTCQGVEIGLFDLPVEIRMTELRREICAQASRSPTGAVPACGNNAGARISSKEELTALLAACGHNKAEVARRAGVDRTTVWRRMKRFNVPT